MTYPPKMYYDVRRRKMSVSTKFFLWGALYVMGTFVFAIVLVCCHGVPLEGKDLYSDTIRAEARMHPQLTESLIRAVIKAESSWRPNVVSRAGAQGLMQLMPGTAKELGVQDPFDPHQNIAGGCKYLRRMLEMFHGDLDLALAAYNAGPGNVKKYGGVPPFEETKQFIIRVRKWEKQYAERDGRHD